MLPESYVFPLDFTFNPAHLKTTKYPDWFLLCILVNIILNLSISSLFVRAPVISSVLSNIFSFSFIFLFSTVILVISESITQKRIKKIIVGADRIAANGDVANKIGTYSISVLAKEHQIPFYVAAPLSTIDFSIKDGGDIPIEERDANEVTSLMGKKIAPDDVEVYNPVFDITPNQNVTAIITEYGIIKPPYSKTLRNLKLNY